MQIKAKGGVGEGKASSLLSPDILLPFKIEDQGKPNMKIKARREAKCQR